MDQQNDTHREIAHLVGVYPGYAIASYAGQSGNYSKDQLFQAAQCKPRPVSGVVPSLITCHFQ